MASFYLNYLFKGPIDKYSPILGKHNSAHDNLFSVMHLQYSLPCIFDISGWIPQQLAR